MKKIWVKRMIYIDLLSGSGLSQIIETGDPIAGSSVIATDLALRRFDEAFLVELDETYCAALEKRMKKIGTDFTIFRDDCNSVIAEICDKLSSEDHYLAFVDCQSGMEIQWTTIEQLLEKPGDLILNFQTANIYRSIRQWQEDKDIDPLKLNTFFGDSRWTEYNSREECLEGYMLTIQESTSRDVVIPLQIRGPRSYYYDLILATRTTRGGSPWLNPVKELQERLHRIGPGIMENVLNIVKGRQNTLNGFFES